VRLSEEEYKRISAAFGKNIKKLINYQPDTWRYKISSYRFFYEMDNQNKIVFMISVDNRQNAY
jgi:mRNA interferase RelE/StbE